MVRKSALQPPHPIGVFDSGVGGLNIVREMASLLPHQAMVYLADQAHAPYGRRPMAEVLANAQAITRFLLRKKVRLIVIACNTISAPALHPLRRLFPNVPFVGMEPAVKPAVAQTRTGVVGVLATQVTFQGQLFSSLMSRFAGHARVLTQACPGLVEAIENGRWEAPETEALLRGYIKPLLAAGADQLVLGCTHYPFLRPLIERIAGPDVAVIDPAPAVARQAARLLGHLPVSGQSGAPVRHVFFTTGNEGRFHTLAAALVPELPPQSWEVRPCRWHQGEIED